MQFDIPGWGMVSFENVALDYNGTIAVDGAIPESVACRLKQLAELAHVHVLTADTFGTVREQCAPFDVTVDVFPSSNAAESKKRVVEELSSGTCCFGNGYNDRLMFEVATLSIGIIGREGLNTTLVTGADVLVTDPADAFDLLLKPGRLVATLRG